jgi:hypothetical protein
MASLINYTSYTWLGPHDIKFAQHSYKVRCESIIRDQTLDNSCFQELQSSVPKALTLMYKCQHPQNNISITLSPICAEIVDNI